MTISIKIDETYKCEEKDAGLTNYVFSCIYSSTRSIGRRKKGRRGRQFGRQQAARQEETPAEKARCEGNTEAGAKYGKKARKAQGRVKVAQSSGKKSEAGGQRHSGVLDEVCWMMDEILLSFYLKDGNIPTCISA
jgi:hypothetical protein